MEEKEEKQVNMQGKKLTYEELEAYVNQTITQARKIYKENEMLLKELEGLKNQRNYTEINLAFKMLEYKDFFSKEAVKKVAKRLEEVLTPVDNEIEEQKETSKE